MTKTSGRIAIVGVGNVWRGDDAVGILTAREIGRSRKAQASHVTVIESDGELTGLLECFKGFDRVYLIDALRTGRADAGRVFEFDAAREPLRESETLRSSTHAMSVAQAIEMARALGRMPAVLRVYGIEARGFEHGASPSDAVMTGSRIVAERIIEEIHSDA